MRENDAHGAGGNESAARLGLAPGTELAGYRIGPLLGRGGMGVVYRAHDLALDRDVALKLLAPELAEDVGFRERFLRESRLAASLDHPAIIPIYDAGEVAGQLYIAMRLVEGTDLKRLLGCGGQSGPGARSGTARAGRRRARRGSRARSRAPRRQAVERPRRRARSLLSGRLRALAAAGRAAGRARARRVRSARSTTSRPSRSAATSSTGGPTCTRSGVCCTSALPAGRRSPAARTRRSCSPTSRTTHRPCRGSRPCLRRRSRRSRTSATSRGTS